MIERYAENGRRTISQMDEKGTNPKGKETQRKGKRMEAFF